MPLALQSDLNAHQSERTRSENEPHLQPRPPTRQLLAEANRRCVAIVHHMLLKSHALPREALSAKFQNSPPLDPDFVVPDRNRSPTMGSKRLTTLAVVAGLITLAFAAEDRPHGNYRLCTEVTPECPAIASTYGYYPILSVNSFFLALFGLCCLTSLIIGVWSKTWTYNRSRRRHTSRNSWICGTTPDARQPLE